MPKTNVVTKEKMKNVPQASSVADLSQRLFEGVHALLKTKLERFIIIELNGTDYICCNRSTKGVRSAFAAEVTKDENKAATAFVNIFQMQSERGLVFMDFDTTASVPNLTTQGKEVRESMLGLRELLGTICKPVEVT